MGANLSPGHETVLRMLVDRLPLSEVNWALTGSLCHRLQGVPLSVHDIDVQTDGPGASTFERRFAEYAVEPLRVWESKWLRSQFATFTIEGVDVELMGAVQARLPEGTWAPPTDPAEHRLFVEHEHLQIPVLELDYEALSYDQLERFDRAELLRRYVSSRSADGSVLDPSRRSTPTSGAVARS